VAIRSLKHIREFAVALTASTAIAVIAMPQLARAQGFPTKPIRLLVPFGPGSGTDIVARIMAEGLTEQLKQPVVVENREGAGGVVGAVAVKNSPADGYTLLAISNAFLIAPQLAKTAPYDPIRDFTAVAKFAFVPLTLVVGASSPHKTMKDLIAFMKANPGKVSFATSGKGAQSQLEVEFIKQQFGLKAEDIPYKSTAAAVADTLSGTVAFYLPGFGPMSSNIAAGKLRALAVGAPQRLPGWPDIPTFIEATGIRNYSPAAWLGYTVPAGTPADVVARLEDGIIKTTGVASVREKVAKASAYFSVLGAREYQTEMAAEAEKWGKLIGELNLKTD
jgi:tripartite-type tricarboxylate transporter receptor subunit TctC